MADLSITLRNLLQNLSYQYAMASKQNASNIENSVSNSSTTSSSSKKTVSTTQNSSSSATTSTTSSAASSTKTNSTSKSSSSSLAKLLSSLSATKKVQSTSAINNTSTITNDMELEFFKSYKNAVTTDIYNKLSNNSSMTAADLSNFKSQVAKLSSDEQKLWKSEIAKIESKIETRIFENTTVSAVKPSTTQNSSNGFVNNVLYQNGQKFSGIYTDGLYYQNGVLASGTVNGKVYVDGSLLTGMKSGVMYENGVLFNGTKDGLVYDNGILANGVVNGKFYSDGVLSSGTFLGKTYTNGILVTNTNTSNNTNTTNSNTNTNSAAATNSSSAAATATTPKTLTNNNNNVNIASKKTDANGNVLGYDSNGNLVYLEKTVNGKKYVYTDELQYLNSKTLDKLKTISNATLTDRLMSDIQIVKNAEEAGLKAGAKGTTAYQKAYDASIKSQMIKTTSNMTNTAGEVVEKNGVLYVNDGAKLVKLNISAETYLELFPPVDRYDLIQRNISDCYFISGCLTDMQKNGTAYAQLLQAFSEDSNGNITIKFAGTLKDYPVTFANGELKTLDGYANGISTGKTYTLPTGTKGTQMLEEAYAIASFAKESNKSVNSIDIDETISTLNNGWQYNVYKEVMNIKSELVSCDQDKISSYLNSIASKVNNGDILFSFASYGTASEYGLTSGHAYSIEKIDTANQMVYITNPWYTGDTIAVPYSVFAKSAYSVNNKVYMNIGYINS